MISIDEIEQHISNTEDFLKSNQENVVRRSNPNLSSITSLDPTKQSSNTNNILENENSKATISSDNRYSDPKEREILIQKLLSDYNERKERRKTENYFDVPDTEDLTSSRRSLTSFNKSQEKEKKVDFTQSTIKWSSRDANTTNSSRKKTFDSSDDDEDEGASELSVDTLGSKQDNREREDNLFFASDILTSSLDVPNQQDRSFEGYSWSLPPPPPLPQPQPPQPQHYQQPPVIPPRSSRDVLDVRSSLQGPKERGRTRTPPKLRSTTKRTASSSSVDRGSRSQSADRVHLSTKDKLKEEAEKEFKKQHPFKPTRATASRSPTAPPTHHSARQSKSHFFDRLDEMSKEHHQRMRKKEKLRSELEKLELMQCTFQPEITQKSKKLVQRKGKDHQTNTSYDVYKEEEAYKEENNLDSLSERLYQEAAIRKKRNHYLSKYMGELEEWNCTFQPSINDNTDKILQKSFQSKQQHQPQQQQHQRVTSTSPHHRAKRASSLSPGRHLSKDKNKSNQTASDSKSRYYTPIHQRVTELQREKQRHLRELKQSREEEQANVLTFRPSIAKKSKTLAEKKFHKEGYAYPLTVENSNNKEESEKEGDSGTESGRFLVKSDVAHRLLNEGRKLARRKQELLYQREQELAETLEKPVMSVGSQKLVYTNQHLREEFANRQKYYEKKSMIYQDHIHDKEEKKYEQYFQPNIKQSKSLQILKQKKPDLLLETTNEKYERLSIIEADLLNEKKQLLMKKYYNSLHYPFQPEINYISKIFGKKSTINDLYENNLAKQSKELLKKQLEEEMNEECTFQPKINEKSKQMIERQQSAVPADDYERFYHEYYKAKGYEEGGEEGGDGRGRSGSPSSVRDGGGGSVASVSSSKLGRINLQQPEKMFQEIQLQRLQKENRRKEELIAREIEELQECTFQPMLHQNHSFLHDQTAIAANEPIIIKGLNRHLELKQLADKLKKEEQEREFNAFHVRNVDKFRRQEDGSTIVKTFDLRVNSPKRLEKKKVYSY